MGGRRPAMSDEREMMAKIERGERLESADEMTPEYRDNLVHLMTMQADSELAGGYGYVSWIQKAPSVEEKHVVAQIDRKSTRLNSSHGYISYAVFCFKKKKDTIHAHSVSRHIAEAITGPVPHG